MSTEAPAWHGPPDQYTSQLANAVFTIFNGSMLGEGILAVSNSNNPNGNIANGGTVWITTTDGSQPVQIGNPVQVEPVPILSTPFPQWYQPPLGNPQSPFGAAPGNVQIGNDSWNWQQRQLTEQDVKRIIEEVLKGNIQEKKEDEKTPNDLGMLMKQFSFPQLMIDIVMKALGDKWPVKKELKERMEDLIVHGGQEENT